MIEAKRVADRIRDLAEQVGLGEKEFIKKLRSHNICTNSSQGQCMHDNLKPLFACMQICECGNFIETSTIRVENVSTDLFSVTLTVESVIEAIAFVTPSVTEVELDEYEKLRDRRATVVAE